MKRLLFGFSCLLLVSLFLTACQGTEDEKEDKKGEEASEQQAPESIKMEGIADHYHTGDKMELTAVLDEETDADHWHWYSRENANDEWAVVSGQETETFTGEAQLMA